MHLFFEDVTSVIDIGNETGNRFDNADYGIYAVRSHVMANNNVFTNFLPLAGAGGIAAFGYECKQFDFGNQYTPNTFTNCYYGVQSKNSNCNILYNEFTDVDVAVNTLSSTGRRIIIFHNGMTNVITGVLSAGNMQCTVNIDENTIGTLEPLAGNTSHAIFLGSMGGNTGNNTSTVTNNVISSKSTYGIQVESVGSVIVKDNTVELVHIGNATLPLKYGVRADGCPKSFFDHNCISRVGTRINTRGLTLADCPTAMVKCNTTGDTEWGIQFIGACDGSLTRGNTMSDNTQAFVLGEAAPLATAVIDDQLPFVDGSNYVVGNIFINDPADYDSYTYSYNQQADVPLYKYNNTIDYPFNNGALSFPLQPTLETAAIPYDQCDPCYIHTIVSENPEGNEGVSYQERIAQDTIGNTDDGDNVWKSKKYLYESLTEDSSTLDSSAIIEIFYDTTGIDAIGKLTDTKNAISATADTLIENDSLAKAERISEAASKNSMVVPQNSPEANEKAVNDIYLNSIASGRYIFTSAELTSLQNIANQCPYTGGNAVYMARNLLRMTNPFTTFNDVQACSGYTSRKAKAVEETMKKNITKEFIFYPNPTYGIISIESRVKKDQDAIIRFQNELGIVVIQKEMMLNKGIAQFDISELAPSVYSYQIFEESGIANTGKIVLIK